MDLSSAFRELRKRNRTVPNPLRLPSETEVDNVEKALGVRFHRDFRRYLLEVSDVVFGIFEPVTITQPGAQTDLLEVVKAKLGKVIIASRPAAYLRGQCGLLLHERGRSGGLLVP